MTRAWLAVMVLGACGAGGDTPFAVDSGVPVTTQLLAGWKEAMTIADFHTANMAHAWSTMKSTDNQLCTSCHTEYGSADEALFFSQVQLDQEILTRFFAVSGSKIVVNDDSFMRAATHQPPVPTHPAFDPATAIGVVALRQFYTLTCGHAPELCGM